MTRDQVLKAVERAIQVEAEEIRFVKNPSGGIAHVVIVFRGAQMAANIDGELSDLFSNGAKKMTVKKSGDRLSVMFSEDGQKVDFSATSLRYSDGELSEYTKAHPGYAPFMLCSGVMKDGRPAIIYSKNPPVAIVVQSLLVEEE